MRDQRGFALLAVVLVVALLGVVATELAVGARLEAGMVRAHRDAVAARHLAEAAVHQAIREVQGEGPIQKLDADGQLVFYRLAPGQTVPVRLTPLPRSRVPLGPGEFSYRLSDEEGRLNLNLAAQDRVERLLEALGVERALRDVIGDSLQDWKDANDAHRLNGAESDHYLRLPVPYRARNAPLQDAAEMLQVRGVTPALWAGTAEQPGLAALVTVHGRNIVNVNTAPEPVLRALGLSPAEVTDIIQGRQQAPYPFVPGRYAGRGLGVGGQTFRIEAEGWVAGQRRARLTAIVQRVPRQGLAGRPFTAVREAPPLGVSVLSWRTEEEP